MASGGDGGNPKVRVTIVTADEVTRSLRGNAAYPSMKARVSEREIAEQCCAIYVPLYGQTHALVDQGLVTHCGVQVDPTNFEASVLWWQPWNGVTCLRCREQLFSRVPDYVAKKLREDDEP